MESEVLVMRAHFFRIFCAFSEKVLHLFMYLMCSLRNKVWPPLCIKLLNFCMFCAFSENNSHLFMYSVTKFCVFCVFSDKNFGFFLCSFKNKVQPLLCNKWQNFCIFCAFNYKNFASFCVFNDKFLHLK